MKNLFACVMMASKIDGNNVYTHTNGIVFLANSKDEAYGMSMKTSYRVFPLNKGWKSHNCHVIDIDEVGYFTSSDKAIDSVIEVEV